MPENSKVTIKALIMGGHEVTVSGGDEKEAIKNISLFSQLPDACPVCQASLFFTYRKVAAKGEKKGGTFYGVKCKGGPAHEKYFHTHDNEAQNLYLIATEEFQLEYAARSAQSSGYEEPPDNGRQQQTRPDREARDSFNQPDNGDAQQQQPEHGGPTSGQRTLMSKLLADVGMTLDQAYIATGAKKKWDDMNPGQAALFIDAVKNIKKEVAF